MSRARYLCVSVAIAIYLGAAPSPARAAVILVTPGNLLAGNSTASSSLLTTPNDSTQTVDQLLRGPDPAGDNGLIFASADTDQRLSVSGFNSSLKEIRIYTNTADPGRVLQVVTIRSSTSATLSLTAGTYLTPLVTNMNLTGAFTHATSDSQIFWVSIPVSAPSGTQSLFFDFGGSSGQGDRVSEVQAFAPLPEPASAAMFGAVVVGTWAAGHRSRCAS